MTAPFRDGNHEDSQIKPRIGAPLFFDGRYRGIDPVESTPSPELKKLHGGPDVVFFGKSRGRR